MCIRDRGDIRDANPETAIAIMGDFNDLPGSAAYNAVVGAGDFVFQNVADGVPEGDRWSFTYKGTRELVDQQMVNGTLATMLQQDSVKILHGPEIDEASDHAPILATYRIR